MPSYGQSIHTGVSYPRTLRHPEAMNLSGADVKATSQVFVHESSSLDGWARPVFVSIGRLFVTFEGGDRKCFDISMTPEAFNPFLLSCFPVSTY